MSAKLPLTMLLALMSWASFAGWADAATDTSNYTIDDVTACSPDAMRLCKDKLPDLDAIQTCMKDNYVHLRPACKARFDKDK